MARATEAQLMVYIAQSAESIIEDDMNESGDWTEEEHEDLTSRALSWCSSPTSLHELAEMIRNYVITPSGHPSYDDGKDAGLDLAADLIEGIQ